MYSRHLPLLALLQFALATPSIAQPGWSQQQLPSGVRELKGVFFTDAQTGWAVGSDGFFGPGTIVHTNDGGANWVRQQPGTDATLNAVHFVTASQGWVVGSEGTILRTTNGGQSWQAQSSGAGFADLVSVHFINANTGWATGFENFFSPGVILRTDNGGQTWVAQPQANSDGVEWTRVFFVDGSNGWILGSSGSAGLLRTTNGGTTWTRITIPASTTLKGLHFTDALNGWVAGYDGTILRTSDGGTTWSPQAVPNPGSPGFVDAVYFTDPNNGWAVGGAGTILSTTNGGTAWSSDDVGTGLTRFYDVHFPAAGTGWAVGFSGSSGRVFRYGQGVGIEEIGTSDLAFGLAPNPAVDISTLTFTLETRSRVVVELLDLQGRAVRAAYAGELPAGEQRLPVEVEGLAPGTYLCRLLAGNQQGTRNLVIGLR
jgi:photosystem II stability/assembly factor-like uncharacterized protein